MAFFNGEPIVDYTKKTFLFVVDEIISSIKSRYPGITTDFGTKNIVVIFLEFIAYLVEKISYSLNSYAREMYFSSAKLRSSVVKLAKPLGYYPSGRVAATALLKITLLQTSAFDILIPAGSQFRTADITPRTFRTLGDATLPAGATGTNIDVWVENSFAFSQSYASLGVAFEEFKTDAKNILLSGIDSTGMADPNVISYTIDTVDFTVVSSFAESVSTSQHIQHEMDNSGRIIAHVGDGVKGALATGVTTITGRYGGGAGGNGSTITQGPSFQNLNGENVSLGYNNAIVTSGGADEESIAEIKVNAPASLQSSNRTVSHNDFVNNSVAIQGVDRALAFTSNDDPLVDENKTEVVVLTSSPTNAQIVGGTVPGAPGVAITDTVDDVIGISINGETPQMFDLGSQANGTLIATALQLAVRAATPEFPLDNALAYTGFVATWNSTNDRFTLTTGLAGYPASIDISAGAPDASIPMGLDTASQTTNLSGAEPSSAVVAAVLTAVTITKPTCNGHNVEVFPADINHIYIDMRVRFINGTTVAAKVAVRNAIRAAEAEFFAPRTSSGLSNPDIEFGGTTWISDVMAVANGVSGVLSLDEDKFYLNGTLEDVTSTSRQFPVLGGIVVRDFDSLTPFPLDIV